MLAAASMLDQNTKDLTNFHLAQRAKEKISCKNPRLHWMVKSCCYECRPNHQAQRRVSSILDESCRTVTLFWPTHIRMSDWACRSRYRAAAQRITGDELALPHQPIGPCPHEVQPTSISRCFRRIPFKVSEPGWVQVFTSSKVKRCHFLHVPVKTEKINTSTTTILLVPTKCMNSTTPLFYIPSI